MPTGYAPYEEAAAAGQARMSVLQRIGQLFAGAGAGIAAGRYAQNPVEALGLGFSGGYGAANAAKQAAEQYAMRKIQAEQEREFRDLQKQKLLADINNPPKPEQPYANIPWYLRPEVKDTPEAKAAAAKDTTQTAKDEFANPPWYLDPKYKNTPEARAAAADARAKSTTSKDNSWMDAYIITTRSGKKYLDVSAFEGEDKAAARRYAASKGIRALESTAVGQLEDIASATANVDDVLDSLSNLLPKDAAGRIVAAPNIRLGQFLQTNAQRAAFNTWRGSAIRTLRATAGSKGLRLNQKEIDLAVKNEIPQITDTWAVAKAKMDNVRKMLHNAENPILQQDWSGGGNAADPLGVR